MQFSGLRTCCTVLRAARIVASSVAVGLLGCQDLTTVDAPDVITPEDQASAAGAHTLAVGAVTRFHRAFGSSDPGQVMGSGLLADEMMTTVPGSSGLYGLWDSRIALDPSPSADGYAQLHDARQQLLSAIGSFQQVAPDSSARIGQLFALLGYTSLFFGENYCAGVPLSHRDADLQPVYGEPLTTAQLFDSALVAFDSALVYGADSARIAHLARVGRGRALLNLGRFIEAAAAVADVPTDYVYQVAYLVEPSLNNGFFDFFEPQNNITVPEQEGTKGINWRSASDPRVPLVNRSPEVIGADGTTEVWQYARYQASDAPIRLAEGLEARLIQAEAALQGGDATTWLTVHNTLRTTVALGPLADPGTAPAREDLHFRERAFWLFLTGHRLGDLRRLVRQYGRDPETVFPTGLWRDGIPYGAATNMAPPATQTTNPHYSGCLSREA